ncbi:MAG: KH domain-containing protein [Chlamydiales bacterium]|nr:KH domain-containing protein [Chlamydiales bacterium]
MEEFVAYIVKNLVSDTEGVQVNCVEEPEKLKIEIRVSPDDVGKIIGRKGNTINAIRTIVRTVATRLGRKVQIDLIQDEKEEVIAEAEPELEAEPVEV